MITVIASITVDIEKITEFVEIFNANVPAVLDEDGCIEYYPTVDIESGLEVQQREPSVVTGVECWDSIGALKSHLGSAHMQEYREKTKDMVQNVSIKILQSV